MNRRRRQFVLLLLAVVLPAGLLSTLAFRFLGQEEELAKQRAATEYISAVDSAGRELAARLEAIKLEVWNQRKKADSSRPGNPAVVFVATWNNQGLVLPWIRKRESSFPSGKFISLLDSGETLEFKDNNPAGASQYYRQALASSPHLEDGCEARLRLARALVKANKEPDALKVYIEMLSTCGSALDEEGIPFNYYAASRMIDLNLDVPRATSYLVREVSTGGLRPPAEATMIQSLLKPLQGDDVETARRSIAAQMEDERLAGYIATKFDNALAGGFGRVRAMDEKWLADGPWLLTATPANDVSEPLLIAVSSMKVAPPGIRLIVGPTNDGIPLGAGFTNVEMLFDPPRTFSGGRVPRTVYGIGLALILGLAVLGGYLLLYGVNRDLQMTEMRSQFVSSVSHELRTPLTAIRMFAETLVLGRAGDDRSRTEYLETIVSESERLARLVDNVLDFSKIEQGRKIYRMKPTAIDEVVRSAARAMQYPLLQQGFNLNIAIDEEIPVLPADADAMEQAILNLLSNAMKYSGNSREVDLRLERYQGDALIRVIDHGIGISAGDLEHIFDKFYRVRSEQTDMVAGTGLGLTLVKHIAEAHGGRVEVQSAVGTGSTFTIRIPFKGSEISS